MSSSILNATVDEAAQFKAYLDQQDSASGKPLEEPAARKAPTADYAPMKSRGLLSNTPDLESGAPGAAPEPNLIREVAPGDHVRQGEVPPSPKALANPPVESEEPEEQPPEVEAAPPAEGEPEEPEEASIDTWDELTDVFSTEENPIEAADLLGHIQIEGREGEGLVPIATAVEFYRSNQGLDYETGVAVERVERELRGDIDTRMQSLTDTTQRLIVHIEQMGRVPDELRASNPEEWIRQTQAVQALNIAVEESLTVLNKEVGRHEEIDTARDDKWTAAQAAATFNRHPDWKQPGVAEANLNEMAVYARKLGFNDDEITDVKDSRMVEVLWGYTQWQKLQDNKPAARRVLRGLPRKNLRVSARNEAAPREAQDKREAAVRARFAQTGKIEDGLSLFERHL